MTNYYEFFLASEDADYTHRYKIDVGLPRFTQIMKILAQKESLKYFQKKYKEYHYGDIIYQNYYNEEVKVFRKLPTSTEYDNHILKVGFQRQKLSIINVPSNVNVQEIYFVQHLNFRMTNRIYMNMVIKTSKEKTFHYVYLSYLHDDTVDNDITDKQIEEFKDIIRNSAPIS